tara:strand:+ start:59 stop:790 length:732 start_codon:yes stop_codon:yes gene_type:complete
MFDFYYNQSLRKLVVAFGSLFNEIFVVRENADGTENQRIRVPIAYGPKEKFIRRLEEQSGISDSTKVQITLPRLGFEISSIDYDPTRHLNKTIQRSNTTSSTFQEVPYNVGFSLYTFTRTMTDNLQIIEQIAPYFNPEFIVTLKLNEIDTDLDVPIVLSNIGIQEDYEGNYLDRRLIASSLNFVCKTRLYSKIQTSPVIAGITIDLNILGDFGDTGDVGNIGITGATGDDISDYIAGDFKLNE